MIFLLDTSALSDLMREDRLLEEYLARIPQTDQVVTCPIVRGEIEYGIRRLPPGRRRDNLKTKARHLFDVISCEPVLESAAEHYAQIKSACEGRGLALDENDLWIAAAALSLGATLVTRDSDFRRIDGLLLADWTR